MSARRLIVLRHGRTAWNDEGRFQGHADVHLDDIGVAEARAAAAVLAAAEPDYVVSSDLARARLTGEEVAAAAGLPLVLDERLREFDVGDAQGLRRPELAERFPAEYEAFLGGDGHLWPRAETREAVAARMTAALTDAVSHGDTVVAVTHGGAASAGIAGFLDMGERGRQAFRGLSNCHWAVLVESPLRWRLLAYNVGPHTSGIVG